MGMYSQRLSERARERRQEEARQLAMTDFERAKRASNVRSGYLPTKGLKDGHCNRYACQAPLKGKPQYSMKDFETSTDNRLYYCQKCAVMFAREDERMGHPMRCRPENAS